MSYHQSARSGGVGELTLEYILFSDWQPNCHKRTPIPIWVVPDAQNALLPERTTLAPLNSDPFLQYNHAKDEGLNLVQLLACETLRKIKAAFLKVLSDVDQRHRMISANVECGTQAY